MNVSHHYVYEAFTYVAQSMFCPHKLGTWFKEVVSSFHQRQLRTNCVETATYTESFSLPFFPFHGQELIPILGQLQYLLLREVYDI